MNYRLCEFLRHPGDGAPFDVEVFESRELERDVAIAKVACASHCHRHQRPVDGLGVDDCRACYNHEIVAGKLTARGGGAEYPIIAGVPRILPADLLHQRLRSKHAAFLAQYGERFSERDRFSYAVEEEKKRTADSFGYQWNAFLGNYDYFREIFLSFTRPFMDAGDFTGKVCLDVGCGSGRPGVTACRLGAEVVGMDLSEAVEAAQLQTRQHALFHVVQADAYAPPFAPVFDLVYCVGVLQHIPSPRKALAGINATLSESSPLLLWIYAKREFWYQPIEWMRAITRRVPVKILHGLSVLAALLSELLLLLPYRLLSRLPGCKVLARRIPGRIYADYPFRENVVGWFDRLQAPVTYYFEEAQIVALLGETGYHRIETYARPDASASWVIRAMRRTDTRDGAAAATPGAV